MLTFNWVFEYQPIASGILTQLQKSRKQFTSRQKRSSTLNPENCLCYTFIFLDLSFICYKIAVYQIFSIKQIKAMYSKMTCHKICLNLSLKTVSVHIFCGVDVMNCETCYEYRITWSGTPGQSNHSFYNKIYTVRLTITMKINWNYHHKFVLFLSFM